MLSDDARASRRTTTYAGRLFTPCIPTLVNSMQHRRGRAHSSSRRGNVGYPKFWCRLIRYARRDRPALFVPRGNQCSMMLHRWMRKCVLYPLLCMLYKTNVCFRGKSLSVPASRILHPLRTCYAPRRSEVASDFSLPLIFRCILFILHYMPLSTILPYNHSTFFSSAWNKSFVIRSYMPVMSDL